MNRLLVFLACVAVIISGLFIVNNFYSFQPYVPDSFFTTYVLSIVIITLGFIRFNKLVGIISLIIGGVSLIPWKFLDILRILLPWILLALGIRFFLIGFLSKENEA